MKMAYEKIGTIENISEIQFDKNIIVTGSVNRVGWMWRMNGMFKKKKEDKIIFRNEHGMITEVVDGEVALNVLKKIK